MTTVLLDGALPGRTRGGYRTLTWGAKILLLVIGLSLTWDAVGEFTYFIRITLWPDVGELYAVLNAGLIVLMMLAVGIGFLMTMASTRPILPVQFWANLCAAEMLIIGLVSAFLHHHGVNRPFIGQVYYWITIVLAFNLGVGVRMDPHVLRHLEKLIDRFSLAIVAFGFTGYLALEAYRRLRGAEMWTGYPGEQFLLPLAHYSRARRWKMALIPFLLILVSGKRGPLAGAMILLAFVVARGRVRYAIIPIVLLAVALAVAPFALEYATVHELVDPESAIGRPLTKWNSMIHFVDVDTATAGRAIEMRATMALMQSSTEWLVGAGFGWYFHWLDDPAQYHYVHLSYWNYVVTYGLVGAIPMFILLGCGFFKMWRGSLRPHAHPLLKEIVLFVVAVLVTAVSANILSIWIVPWVLFGIGLQLTTVAETRW